jgi:alkanesulfonate monooxygenase SsuD/methylene tetrahydromethanopterin reductase-like flavin-dependent oxidoreductase (luciferase family)
MIRLAHHASMPRYGYLLPTRGVVHASPDAETLASRIESEVVGLACRAETLNYSHVWIGDSVLAKPRLEPLTTLAAVATETDSVGLGTAVYLPTLRHPVHVAHLTATVEQLSGGRLSLGVGVGRRAAVRREYENLDLDYERRGARMDEVLDVVTGLWAGEAVSHDGDFFDLDDASIGFSPVRSPPIYVPTSAPEPDESIPQPLLSRIVTHADGWMPNWCSPETYAAGLTEVRAALSDAGRDPDRLDAAYYMDVAVGDDEAAAIDTAREFYEAYYPGLNDLSDEEVRGRGTFGSPEMVSETLDDYADAGVETMVVRFATTNQRVQLDRFAALS